jgi:hypothetical protein
MLTATQKAQVRTYLGWSPRYGGTDSALENAFAALVLEPEHEVIVIALLTDLAGIETKLLDSHKRLKAVKVGSIELDAFKTEIIGLRSEGMRLTGKLSVGLGVERRHNVFGTDSGPRAWWSGPSYGSGDRNYF